MSHLVLSTGKAFLLRTIMAASPLSFLLFYYLDLLIAGECLYCISVSVQQPKEALWL